MDLSFLRKLSTTHPFERIHQIMRCNVRRKASYRGWTEEVFCGERRC